jgi:hypothetical protein
MLPEQARPVETYAWLFALLHSLVRASSFTRTSENIDLEASYQYAREQNHILESWSPQENPLESKTLHKR